MPHRRRAFSALVALSAVLATHAEPARATPTRALRGVSRPTPRVARAEGCEYGGRDEDEDGIADACEDELAARFAPVVYHSSDETNYPTNVDALLRATSLAVYDDDCSPDLVRTITVGPRQADLLEGRQGPSCGNVDFLRSDGTRSRGKGRTFFLADVPAAARAGSRDPREWTTYVHAYANDVGGVTIQYWRVYAYNDASLDHGGDWEGLHVALDAQRRPFVVRLLGHAGIETLDPRALAWEGDHPRVFSEGGGHATRRSGEGIVAVGCSHPSCRVDPGDARTFTRQETWPGGAVRFFDGRTGTTGALLNVGERRRPLHGQAFVRYSGLWGSPGAIYATSGYWGPAFNETAMRSDGFATAWCAGMLGADDARHRDECFASGVSR